MEERIQKIIAAAGIVSRRKAEELIAGGKVKVNGKTVVELGTKADLGKDKITVNGVPIQKKERKIYVLLYKPKGYLCTVEDTHDRPTVLDLLPDWGLRIYPVGRLDMDSSGLLILTNDGKMTQNILHPAKKINKVYRVEVKGVPSPEKIEKLRKGIIVDDEQFAPARLRRISYKTTKSSVWEVIIHEGKKRQIRRMFQAIKHPVKDLVRTNIDFLSLKGLKEGEWRFLKKEELRRLVEDTKEKKEHKISEKDFVMPQKLKKREKYGKRFY